MTGDQIVVNNEEVKKSIALFSHETDLVQTINQRVFIELVRNLQWFKWKSCKFNSKKSKRV